MVPGPGGGRAGPEGIVVGDGAAAAEVAVDTSIPRSLAGGKDPSVNRGVDLGGALHARCALRPPLRWRHERSELFNRLRVRRLRLGASCIPTVRMALHSRGGNGSQVWFGGPPERRRIDARRPRGQRAHPAETSGMNSG